jgi:HNH endonuclease
MERIKIEGLNKYSITEDGQIWDHVKNRWLKPCQNNCGYIQYFLFNTILYTKKWYKVHRLVAFTYIGIPPTLKHEINHIDANKGNNHYSNLEWVTHSENIRKSFQEQGRKCYWKGKNRPSPGIATRMLMANAKFKRVNVSINGEYYKTFDSIADLCEEFKWYRKKFNRIMTNNGEFKELQLSFAD